MAKAMTAMRDTAEWLKELGLAKYVETFVENEIDFDLLADLDSSDLEKLGLPMGPRKRLLRAIADLQSHAQQLAPIESEAPSAPKIDGAQRRQLTVMFCDLADSTALAEGFDPEELRQVLLAYQKLCADSVALFDGHVAKYIGDGLLIYFGYPQAHEDDPRRAVNAGLSIVRGIDGLNRRLVKRHGVSLSIRIGIHTGLVIAGEMGSGETLESEAIVGETPNIAARLEKLAPPNAIAVSRTTHRLVEGFFTFDDLGPQHLKGVSEPISVFLPRCESDVRSRFEAAVKRGVTPMMGRETEINLLGNRWAHAKDGELQVVLLSGEAGIGKSRMLRAFRERIESEEHSRILYYCSPYHQNSALYAVIDQLERALRLEASDGTREKTAKVAAVLDELALPQHEFMPLLAPLLSLPLDDRFAVPVMSPQLLRHKTLEAILAIIEAMAVSRPVLTVVEDAHWADPSTLELLGLLIEKLRSSRILLVVNARPGSELPWSNHANVTALRLNRLTRIESAAFVDRVAGGKSLPGEVFDQLVSRTDGVPLFIEELTKTVLESDQLIERDGGYELRQPLQRLEIPASLHDSLMARLDRLGSVKEVAQLAATLGRTFSREILSAVSALDGQAMEGALAELESAGLIYRRSVAPDIVYEFKHALVQDAAYQSLLKSRRQLHHERIAQVLVESFPESANNELLAHHYTEAGLAEPAIDHWLAAAERAVKRSAYAEAEKHLHKGLSALETLAEGPERRRREIALRNALGVCLMPTRGFGDADVADAFSRAAVIAEAEGDLQGLFTALRGKAQYFMISGNLHFAGEQVDRVISLAKQLDDPGIVIEGHHLGWSSLTFMGDFRAAHRHMEAGLAIYDRDRHHHLTYEYAGHDPGVCCRTFGSLAKWQLGYPDQALGSCREGVKLAEDLAHPFSLTVALWAKGMLHMLRREPAELGKTGGQMIEHSADKGIQPFVPMGLIFRGGALAAAGELADGIAEMREGMAGVRATGTQYTLPLFVAWLADMQLKSGQIEEGLGTVEEGISLSETIHDRFSLPEFHRLKAQLMLAGPEPAKAEAEASLETAIEIARRQGARLLELRAITDLALLLAETNRRSTARRRLARAHGWFKEGLETPDLREAGALLGELS